MGISVEIQNENRIRLISSGNKLETIILKKLIKYLKEKDTSLEEYNYGDKYAEVDIFIFGKKDKIEFPQLD